MPCSPPPFAAAAAAASKMDMTGVTVGYSQDRIGHAEAEDKTYYSCMRGEEDLFCILVVGLEMFCKGIGPIFH